MSIYFVNYPKSIIEILLEAYCDFLFEITLFLLEIFDKIVSCISVVQCLINSPSS